MSRQIVVVGTDTGIGKTVFSAGLANLLGANYWKPVQAGLEGETDAQLVERLGCLDADRILPELYRLRTPASPHHSAELEGIRIDVDLLKLPEKNERPLVIEGAGGVMVPLNYGRLFIDAFEQWQVPVVLCASTRLGTINDSLLSLEALRRRQIRVLGIAFIGEKNPESETAVCEMGRVRWLGRLPWLSPLTSESLELAFKQSFLRDDFLTL